MTNLYLQKKSIERNKFYKILISLMVLSFSAFLLYSFISCINDVNGQSLYMLGNTLYTLPYLKYFLYFSHLNVVTNSIGTMSLYALPKKV